MDLPFIEKYRPKCLNEVVSQDETTKILKLCVTQNKLTHMLFYGPPGSGKTSTIMALSRDIYGEYYKSMILELNGSDDRGINIIRTQIKNFAKTKNIVFPDKPKIIILDEADSLTTDAQFALRRVIEKYTSNVRFCIICNYLNKVIPAIQSRCVTFQFSGVNTQKIKEKIKEIKKLENLKLKIKDINIICEYADGDFRKILNFLQQRKFTDNDIIQYFFNIKKEHFIKCSELVNKTDVNFFEIKDELEKLVLESGTNFSGLLLVFTQISIKAKKWTFLKKLADLEYKYYLSNYSYSNIFLTALCSCF